MAAVSSALCDSDSRRAAQRDALPPDHRIRRHRLPRLAAAAGRAHGAGDARRRAGAPARAPDPRRGGRPHRRRRARRRRRWSASTAQRAIPTADAAARAERADAGRPRRARRRRRAATTSTRAARRAARRYVYRIWNRPEPSPFWRRYAWHMPLAARPRGDARAPPRSWSASTTSPRSAPPAAMPRTPCAACCAASSSGAAHCSSTRSRRPRSCATWCATSSARWSRSGRAGAAPISRALLAARDRTLAAATAPAHGLCLVEIRYDEAGG